MAAIVPTVEDAFARIVSAMHVPGGATDSNLGYDLYIPKVISAFIQETQSKGNGDAEKFQEISTPFFDAAWELCRRGVVRPGIRALNENQSAVGGAGAGFAITPFGRNWLAESDGKYDYVPTEPTHFAKTTAKFDCRFGDGFRQRSQEAIKCYGANAYLACCAMCGAAAESIMLSLAIAKDGDEEKILKIYTGRNGRYEIENLLIGQSNLKQQFKSYTSLLKYWRDFAAHGRLSAISANEANISLFTMLGFAQFSDKHWDSLTK